MDASHSTSPRGDPCGRPAVLGAFPFRFRRIRCFGTMKSFGASSPHPPQWVQLKHLPPMWKVLRFLIPAAPIYQAAEQNQ